ncbi:MAG TPA: RHS repeat-associated core domain-containing protein, partial [Actinomycetota bacterium]|nr:RHS repeat-associated core domain-containing protein [Actinomycetota bacterium]
GGGFATNYSYNDANELEQMNEASGANKVIFGYNDLGQRTDTWYNSLLDVIYNSNGDIIPPSAAAHTHYTYDDAGKLTNIKTIAVSGPVTLSDLTYSYAVPTGSTCPGAATGLSTSSKQSVTDNMTAITTSYCYDVLGRLTSATTPGGATYSYGWDKNTNRTSDDLGTHIYNDNDQVDESGTVFDGAGNLTESTVFDSIDYNGINQTKEITPAGQSAVPFAYAGSGQADRTLAGSTTAQNGTLGVQTETTGSALTSYVREPSGNLVYQKLSSGQTFYYYFDGLGSVIGQMDSGGNQRAKYTYDPFGAHATETGINGTAPANPWRWMGGYLDSSTGLYHFGERYYHPAFARFLQVDPIRGGCANSYSYVYGDPINAQDLSGLACGPVVAKFAEYAGIYGLYTSAVDALHGKGGWKDTRRQVGFNVIKVAAAAFHTKILKTQGEIVTPRPANFPQIVKWAEAVSTLAAAGIVIGTGVDAYCKYTAVE